VLRKSAREKGTFHNNLQERLSEPNAAKHLSKCSFQNKPSPETKKHHEFMELALQEAKKSLEHGEVPVGCAIVDTNTGRVLGSAHNEGKTTNDGTQHCEIILLERSLMDLSDKEIGNSTLYVTCEPCIMCAYAIRLCRIPKVVFGCANAQFGGCGSITSLQKNSAAFTSSGIEIQDVCSFSVVKGIRSTEALSLLQRFYSGVNPHSKSKRMRRAARGVQKSH